MLRPRDTPTRECTSLNGLWRFAVDTDGVGRSDGWWRHTLPGRREAPVPASYNDLFPDPAVHDHVGDVWYQRVIRVPRRWEGQRIVLRFDSATHRAVVWVDDTEVVAHEGGYTPFEADLTDLVEPGGEHRVTVVVDNTLSWQSIPPGFVEQTPDGPRQRYFHDFFNYAGLHRSVWLHTTPAPTSATSPSSPGWPERQASSTTRSKQSATRSMTSASSSATLTASRSREPPAPPAALASRTCTSGGRARATSTSSMPNCGGR